MATRKTKSTENRGFLIYDKDKIVNGGISPINLSTLKPGTVYNLEIVAVENNIESARVPVPQFTTVASEV